MNIACIDQYGLLYLPKMNGKIDYEQCILLNNQSSIQWLHQLFEWLKTSARSFSLDQIILK